MYSFQVRDKKNNLKQKFKFSLKISMFSFDSF